jgi:hypothetical protein
MGKLASNRVVDAHASQLVSGYRKPQFVGVNRILPIVDVVFEAGKFMEFAADASVIRSNMNRALGDGRSSIEMRVGEGSYATGEVGIKVPLYDRELRNVPQERRADYEAKKRDLAAEAHLLLMEYTCKGVLTDATKYNAANTVTLAGTDQWKTSTGTPVKNLRDWLWVISLSTGIDISELGVALAPKPWRALLDSADVRDRLKYTGRELSTEILKGLLTCGEVTLLAGMYASAFNPDDPTDVTFTFLYDDEVIVYPLISKPSIVDPLPGAICRVQGYPIVSQYRDEDKSADITAVDDNWGLMWKPANRRLFLGKNVSGL